MPSSSFINERAVILIVSSLDQRSSGLGPTGTIRMIGDVKKENHNLEARFLINRRIAGTKVGGELRKALEIFNMGAFQTEICQRVVYVEALIYGVSVMQYAPQSKGALEFSSFCREVEMSS